MSMVQFSFNDSVAIVTLNHPERRNVLGQQMIAELCEAFSDAVRQEARALIVTANSGEGVWSAGSDIAELPESRRDPLGWSDPFRQLMRAMQSFPAPVIAQIDGSVWGGACEMALSADIVVATLESSFALTPGKLGLPYNMAGLSGLLSLAGSRAIREMILTARPVNAEKAYHFGLINHLVDAGEINVFCVKMAQDIARLAPLALRAMKAEMQSLSSAQTLSAAAFEQLQGLRRAAYDSDDYKEGVRAFKEGRKAIFTGR